MKKIEKQIKIGYWNVNLRYFLWTIIGIIGIMGLVLANNIFTNSPSNYWTADNITTNNTGIFYSGTKAFSRTADVVVCRGTSPADDLYKSFTCDVVCKSTDNDCSNEIQSAFNQNGTIIIKEGDYSKLSNNLIINSNTNIIGKPEVLLNLSNNKHINVVSNKPLENVKITGITFYNDNLEASNNAQLNLSKLSYIRNIELRDLTFINSNSTPAVIELTTNNQITDSYNININNINFINTTAGIRIKDVGSTGRNEFFNVNIGNIYYYDSTNNAMKSNNGNVINLGGVNGFTIKNIYAYNKYSDGPVLITQRSDNGKIENMYSYFQRDFLVSLADGTRNINIKNIVTENPSSWGSLYIHNDNFVDYIENINVDNVVCLNCGNTSSEVGVIDIFTNIANSEEIRNIKISNIYINGSQYFGAITVRAKNGGIKNVRFENGLIENIDEAALHVSEKNLTDGLTFKDIEIKNPALDATDADRRACIVFYNPNATNVKIDNVYCHNETGNSNITKGIRVSTPAGSFVSGQFINNRFSDGYPLYQFTASLNSVYVDNQIYSGALTVNSCTNSSVFLGKTIENSSTSCSCKLGAWKCWAMT